MPLYDTEYTHALIMAMVCSLAAFLLSWLWNLASAELHRHGAAKMFLFAALAVPLALWSVGKVGGGDPDGGAQMGGASATYAYGGIGNLATSIWNRARQPIPPMNTCGLWNGMAQGGYQVLWIQGKQCVWYRLWPYQQ